MEEVHLSTVVISREEVLVTKGEAYIRCPEKNTRTDGKAGEMGVLVSQSFVHEDVSGLA